MVHRRARRLTVRRRPPDRRTQPGRRHDPQAVRLYRLISEFFECEPDDDPRLEEVADAMARMAQQAYDAGVVDDEGSTAQDDLPFDLLDALALETDPRVQRLMDLMRERGWARWTRLDRLPESPEWGRRGGRPPVVP